MRCWLLLVPALVACSSSDPNDTRPPLPQPGRITILAGDAQAAQVRRPFPVPLTVRLTTTSGDPLAGFPIVALAQDFPPARDTTDAQGEVALQLEAGTLAMQYTLQVTVDQPAYFGVVATNATATVLPGQPHIITYRDFPQKALVGESIDLDGIATGAIDSFANPVPIVSQAIQTTAPFTVTGTMLSAPVEVSQDLNYRINGIPFPLRFSFVRDLRVLAGATGSWRCASSGGLDFGGGLTALSRTAQVVVDSVLRGGAPGDEWTFYLTSSWQDTLSNGTTRAGSGGSTWGVFAQQPESWWVVYATSFHQTSSAPLSFVEDGTGATFCSTWTGTPFHSPVVLTR